MTAAEAFGVTAGAGVRVVPRSAAENESEPTEAVLALVRALARRRLGWLEHIGFGDAAGADAAATELQAGLDDLDAPHAERRWAEADSSVQAINSEIAACAARLKADVESPLARLAATLGLSESERDLLVVCLAVELDPALGPIYALLQRNPARCYATETLAARLTGRPRAPLLSRAGVLARWEIIETLEAPPGEPRPLRLDPHIVDYLCGRPTIDPALFDAMSMIPSLSPLASWPLQAAIERVERTLAQGTPVRVIVVGPRGSGRRTLAASIAAALGTRAFGIDATAVADSEWPRVYVRALRQALLFAMAPVWHGEGLARRRPPLAAVAPIQFVVTEPDSALPPEPGTADHKVLMPPLTIDERAELWRRHVPSARVWAERDIVQLSERFRLEIGDITSIARHGVTELEETRELCRLATRERLGDLAQLIDCPFRREDLALSETIDRRLDELLFEARERTRFWENASARRLFPRGTALVALFTGLPGTGKTMTAQVIAAELGLDLFRIDLATSISKYIGETAKNLRRIFSRAEEMNAVLLFDEADALFSKRTEVRDSHDRYANTDTNYLLQLLENFGGIALLSSNKRENMDTAFVRRIRYILDFQRPAERERTVIWRRLVEALAGESAAVTLGPKLDRVARVVEMSGAQIKLAVLAALFAARKSREPLSIAHIYHGITRELAKEGRGISPRDRERIEQHG